MSTDYNTGVYIAFGYHKLSEAKNQDDKNAALFLNISNSLAYIPLIGTIIGIARVIFFAIAYHKMKNNPEINEQDKKGVLAEIYRGLFEITSCGILLGIPDLIITINRNNANKAHTAFSARHHPEHA